MSAPEITEIKPPQVLRERVRREVDAALAPRGGFGGLPVDRAQLAELLKPETLRRNADSLPVLAAFQEFLDVERRRTRGRMLAMTALFLIILLAVIGAASLVGLSAYRKTRAQTLAMQTSLEDLRAQVAGEQSGARGSLLNLEAETEALKTIFDRTMGSFQVEQKGLSSQLAGMNTNIAGLRGTIARLQNENAELQRQVQQRAEAWQGVTNRVEEILLLLSQASARSPSPPATPDTAPPALPPDAGPDTPVPPQRGSLVLAIIPAGGGSAIDWRVPLPPTQE